MVSFSSIRCRLDPGLDQALFAYQERLGAQLIQAREEMERLRSLGASISSDFTSPLSSSLDRALAPVGLSTESLADSLLLVGGPSVSDRETTMSDRFGSTVVSGRLLLPGTRDLSPIREMSRIFGGFEEILRAFPDLDTLPVGDDTDSRTYSDHSTFPTRMIVACTYEKVTTTPATSCAKEISFTNEVTAGIDIPLSEAALSVGVSVDSLHIYIFWLGRPEASPASRTKARVMGLTNSQFVDAVSKTNREKFTVVVIPDPGDISRLAGAFGSDAPLVVSRSGSPIEFFPVAEDMADYVRRLLRSSSVGSAGPSGIADFSSPSIALLSTLDIEKTFGAYVLAESLVASSADSSGSSAEFAEAAGSAIKSQLLTLQALMQEAQSVLGNTINEITNLLSMVNALLGDTSNGLLDCVFGSSFSPLGGGIAADVGLEAGIGGIGGPGSPGSPGSSSSNPFDEILSLVESQAANISEFLRSVGALFGIASDISCGSSFVTSSASVQPSFNGSLSCQIDSALESGFELPVEVDETLGIAKVVLDVLNALFDTVRTSIRSLRLTVSSMSISLRLSASRRTSSSSSSFLPSPAGSVGCTPPEATRLAALLSQRALSAFTPTELT